MTGANMSVKHNMETLGAHPKYQKVSLGSS